MTGAVSFCSMVTGPATAIATLSALCRPSRFGASSPNTSVAYEMISVTRKTARPEATELTQEMPSDFSQPAIGSASVTAAVAEAPNPTSVMPTWIAARNRDGSSVRRSTVRARLEPSSACILIAARRALTSAISAAAK